MNKLLIGIFLCFITCLCLLNGLSEDQRFSEQENRVLSQMPDMTVKSFLSVDFTNDFEEYLSDQFIWKEWWTRLKADAERAAFKQENNGVFFGKDQFLLERFEKPGEQLQNNIKSIDFFANKAESVTSYILLAPTSVEIYHEKLPLYAQSFSQKKTMEYVKNQLTDPLTFIDAYKTLMSQKDESIYFRTDHHWTMRGAYYAYVAAAKSMGITHYEMDDFFI